MQGPLEKMQKSASFQKAMLNKKPVEPPLEEGSVEDVGRDELQGYEEPRRTRLKVLRPHLCLQPDCVSHAKQKHKQSKHFCSHCLEKLPAT